MVPEPPPSCPPLKTRSTLTRPLSRDTYSSIPVAVYFGGTSDVISEAMAQAFILHVSGRFDVTIIVNSRS
jgi:hypothetical protein